MENPDIVNYLINKKQVKLPQALLRQRMITELNESLKKGNLFAVSKKFYEIHDNFEKYFDANKMEEISNNMKSLDEKINQKLGNDRITEDDKKIISFLANNPKESNTIDTLEISGTYYFISEVTNDLNKKESHLTDNLKASIFMWLFVTLYELLIHQIDRKAYNYLINQEKQKEKPFKNFMKTDRSHERKHSTPGQLNMVFSQLISELNDKNESIIGNNSIVKIIRNNISHSNLYFDKEEKSIVKSGGEKISLQDFADSYYKLFSFSVEWMKALIGKDLSKEKMEEEIKKGFKTLGRDYWKLNRSGYSKRFSNWVLKIMKEMRGNENGKK